MAGFFLGTSGFQYDHWKGDFYPDDIPRSQWFSHYSTVFKAVEINNTFYGLPSRGTFDDWREQAPDDFIYSLKFSRYGTHMKYLKDPEETQENFLERARLLEDHLGPILLQLPPGWSPDPGRLDRFLDHAPEDLRWAVEFRNQGWLRDDIYRILERHGAALCIHDLLEDHPRHLTADWTYLRFHGPEKYAGSYPSEVLQGEAGWITAQLKAGTDVYTFFNNDENGMAPRNARELGSMVPDGP